MPASDHNWAIANMNKMVPPEVKESLRTIRQHHWEMYLSGKRFERMWGAGPHPNDVTYANMKETINFHFQAVQVLNDFFDADDRVRD